MSLLAQILVHQIEATVELGNQQRGFRSRMDGCRDNIVGLDALIRSQYQSHKSLFMAVLDITKAFDSVETSAIITMSAAAGLPPPPPLEYLREFYIFTVPCKNAS